MEKETEERNEKQKSDLICDCDSLNCEHSTCLLDNIEPNLDIDIQKVSENILPSAEKVEEESDEESLRRLTESVIMSSMPSMVKTRSLTSVRLHKKIDKQTEVRSLKSFHIVEEEEDLDFSRGCICNFGDRKNHLLNTYIEYYKNQTPITCHVCKLAQETGCRSKKNAATLFRSPDNCCQCMPKLPHLSNIRKLMRRDDLFDVGNAKKCNCGASSVVQKDFAFNTQFVTYVVREKSSRSKIDNSMSQNLLKTLSQQSRVTLENIPLKKMSSLKMKDSSKGKLKKAFECQFEKDFLEGNSKVDASERELKNVIYPEKKCTCPNGQNFANAQRQIISIRKDKCGIVDKKSNVKVVSNDKETTSKRKLEQTTSNLSAKRKKPKRFQNDSFTCSLCDVEGTSDDEIREPINANPKGFFQFCSCNEKPTISSCGTAQSKVKTIKDSHSALEDILKPKANIDAKRKIYRSPDGRFILICNDSEFPNSKSITCKTSKADKIPLNKKNHLKELDKPLPASNSKKERPVKCLCKENHRPNYLSCKDIKGQNFSNYNSNKNETTPLPVKCFNALFRYGHYTLFYPSKTTQLSDSDFMEPVKLCKNEQPVRDIQKKPETNNNLKERGLNENHHTSSHTQEFEVDEHLNEDHYDKDDLRILDISESYKQGDNKMQEPEVPRRSILMKNENKAGDESKKRRSIVIEEDNQIGPKPSQNAKSSIASMERRLTYLRDDLAKNKIGHFENSSVGGTYGTTPRDESFSDEIEVNVQKPDDKP